MPSPPSVRRLAADPALIPLRSPAPARTARVTKGDMLAAIGASRRSRLPTADSCRRRAGPRASPPSMLARRRGADDAAAPDHRPAPRRGAAHRRDPDDLQRGRHEPRSWSCATKYKDAFKKKHGVKLGFMSFFVKAGVEALKEFPAVNAEIDGDRHRLHNYYDIGVAVSTERA